MNNMTKEEFAKWRHRYNTKNKTVRLDPNGERIEMKLTFEQYLQIWIDSGHMDKCGRGAGKYCMSRKGDKGHYEEGNVFINSFIQNLKDRQGTKRTPAALASIKMKLKARRDAKDKK